MAKSYWLKKQSIHYSKIWKVLFVTLHKIKISVTGICVLGALWLAVNWKSMLACKDIVCPIFVGIPVSVMTTVLGTGA